MLAYLDHSATAPLRAEAAAAMLPWLTEHFGNPSGSHSVARRAQAAVDEARDTVGDALGVDPGGVIFTGGGTEADNMAVLGVTGRRRGAVVITGIEHDAVRRAAEASGLEVRIAAVGADGLVDLDSLAATLDGDVALVSIMAVNNEIGTIQPLEAAAELVRRRARHAVLHTDAVAAMAWVDVAAAAADFDLVSISAHKFGGPQGVGALAVRHGHGQPIELAPISHGGGQERERRSGTHNVAGIAGMAAAAAATVASRAGDVSRVAPRRDRLVAGIVAGVPGAIETAAGSPKGAGHAHIRFEGIESESLLVLLDDAGVCGSAGSACASGAMEPSHVLLAMGIEPVGALGSLRLTLGPTTTDAEVDLVLRTLPGAVAQLRAAGIGAAVLQPAGA